MCGTIRLCSKQLHTYSVQVLHACSLHREHAVQEVTSVAGKIVAGDSFLLFSLVYAYCTCCRHSHTPPYSARARRSGGISKASTPDTNKVSIVLPVVLDSAVVCGRCVRYSTSDWSMQFLFCFFVSPQPLCLFVAVRWYSTSFHFWIFQYLHRFRVPRPVLQTSGSRPTPAQHTAWISWDAWTTAVISLCSWTFSNASSSAHKIPP